MKKINNNVSKYVNHIKRIVYNRDHVIIYDDKYKYLYIDRNIKNRGDFLGRCLSKVNIEDEFSLFVIDNEVYDNLDTIIELYKNTVSSTVFDPVYKKKIYDSITNRMNEIYDYYYQVQDKLEKRTYLEDSDKYLLVNISIIYNLLDIGHHYLKMWFNEENTNNRIVLNIGDVSDNNFYNGYIINTSRGFKDNFIGEISLFFKYHYLDEGFFREIEYFFEEFSVSVDEKYLFFSYLCLIPRIDIGDRLNVYSLIKYVGDVNLYLNNYKEAENTD